MTYEEWVTKYEYYEQPEDGWRLCDYDRAERATMIREELREEYRMNNIRNRADEIVLNELIFA